MDKCKKSRKDGGHTLHAHRNHRVTHRSVFRITYLVLLRDLAGCYGVSQSSLASGLGLKPGKPVLSQLGGGGCVLKGRCFSQVGELVITEAPASAKVLNNEGRESRSFSPILSIGKLPNKP